MALGRWFSNKARTWPSRQQQPGDNHTCSSTHHYVDDGHATRIQFIRFSRISWGSDQSGFRSTAQSGFRSIGLQISSTWAQDQPGFRSIGPEPNCCSHRRTKVGRPQFSSERRDHRWPRGQACFWVGRDQVFLFVWVWDQSMSLSGRVVVNVKCSMKKHK